MTYEEAEKMFADKGYAFFKGDLNLNIFAVRNHVNTNIFDDFIYVVYEQGKKKIVKEFKCTTESGKYYLNSPLNMKGTAIIVPGQYRGAYTFGLHQGKYECLRQAKPLKYWRDNNKDSKHDLSGKIYEENGFTNIHRSVASGEANEVGKFSAGCIVLKRAADFNELMSIAKKSAKKYGDSFTFTLFSKI